MLNEPMMGTSKIFDVNDLVGIRTECECSDPSHAIYTYVEKEFNYVSITFHVTASYSAVAGLWDRVKSALRILFTGKIDYEANALLSKEAAQKLC